MIRFRDETVRYFTLHEAKLIQTFPHDFHITGSWGEGMRQIGNAVPVHLAYILGKRLHTYLVQHGHHTPSTKSLSLPPATYAHTKIRLWFGLKSLQTGAKPKPETAVKVLESFGVRLRIV